jgi:hypothetical protein
LNYEGFDSSSLSYFRKRLVYNGQQHYAFDCFLAIAHTAGFIRDKVTFLADTTWVGAGAIQCTDTLLCKGIGKLLRALRYATPRRRRNLWKQPAS